MQELKQAIRLLLKERSPHSHGYKHLSRVAANTKLLLSKDYTHFSDEWKHDCLVLAWTHDLEDPKYSEEKDEKRVKSLLQRFLKVLTPTLAQSIITRSSWSNEQKQLRDTKVRDWDTLDELVVFRHILSDADKLDAIDDHGLERCGYYIREKNPTLTWEDPELFFLVQKHAHEKLLLLPDYLYSPTARQLGFQMRAEMKQKLQYFHPQVENSRLRLVAAGLNIEGGRPFAQLNSKQKWANLVLVLDHPLHMTSTFEESLKEVQEKKYVLLENLFSSINEKQLLVAYLSLIYHYAVVEGKKLLIHIHQFPEYSQKWIDLIKQYWKKLGWKSEYPLVFLSDTPTFVSTLVSDYKEADVVLSLSQCAGVDSQYPTGTWFLPYRFIPMKGNCISMKDRYQVQNDLCNQALTTFCHPEVVSLVNSCYVSTSSFKHKEKASSVPPSLHQVSLLEYDEIWNPLSTPHKYQLKWA